MEETVAAFVPAGPSPFDQAYEWGLGLIRGLQSPDNPLFAALMKQVTRLGGAPFYAAALLFVFWCLSARKGLILTLTLLSSAWLNGFCKVLFAQPRPFHLDASVGLVPEQSFGFPSGHAQFSLFFWFAAAAALRKRYPDRGGIAPWTGAACLVLAVAFSRVYLGVHFPQDILGGWFLGGVTLAAYRFLAPGIAGFLRGKGPRIPLFLAAGAALLMNASGAEVSIGGLFLGFSAGYALLRRRGGYSAHIPVPAPAKNRGSGSLAALSLLRLLLGMAGLAALQFLLKSLLPGEGSLFRGAYLWGGDSPWARLGGFLRHAALGLFAGAGAPWLFIRLGLASPFLPDGADGTGTPAGPAPGPGSREGGRADG